MVAVVLGPFEEHLEGLVAVGVALAVAGVGERVGLVHEEHPADRRVDQLIGLDRGLPEELADQIGPLGLHQVIAAEQPEGVEHPAEDAGDRGLSGARGAGEDEVAFGRLHRKALIGAQPRHLQLRRQGLDLALHRLQADHALQLGERLREQHRVGGPRREARGNRLGRQRGLLSYGLRRRDRCRRRYGVGREPQSVAQRATGVGLGTGGGVHRVLTEPSAEGAEGHRREPGGIVDAVVPLEAVVLGDGREPGGRVHERGIDPVHRPVERQGRGAAPGALVGAGQPVAQLLALGLLAAAAHQRGRQQRLGLPVHLQTHPGHTAEEPGLDAEQRVVDEGLGVPDQLVPVLDEIGPAGVQKAHLGVGVDRGSPARARSNSGTWRPSSQWEAWASSRSRGLSRTGCTHQPSQYQEFNVRRYRDRCSPKRSRLRYMRRSAVVVSTRSACSPSQASAIPGSIRTAVRNSSSACG